MSLLIKNAPAALEFVIDGGGAEITLGEKGHIRAPFSGTIRSVSLFADQIGSIEVDIWKTDLAGFPPAVANSITGGHPPAITNAQDSEDTVLSGWDRTVNEGDIFAFNVDSVSTIQRVTISLKVQRS